jgi:hypothetical protein
LPNGIINYALEARIDAPGALWNYIFTDWNNLIAKRKYTMLCYIF